MRKRAYVVFAAVFVAAFGLAIWQARREPEPVYQGKRLSTWLGEASDDWPAVRMDLEEKRLPKRICG